MKPEEILANHASNYKKTVERDEKTLFHLQVNGFEAMTAMQEYASLLTEQLRQDIIKRDEIITKLIHVLEANNIPQPQ